VEGFEDEEESEPAHEAAGSADGVCGEESGAGFATDAGGEEEDECDMGPAGECFDALAEVGECGGVHEEVDEVSVEEGSGEEPPPFALGIGEFDEACGKDGGFSVGELSEADEGDEDEDGAGDGGALGFEPDLEAEDGEEGEAAALVPVFEG